MLKQKQSPHLAPSRISYVDTRWHHVLLYYHWPTHPKPQKHNQKRSKTWMATTCNAKLANRKSMIYRLRHWRVEKTLYGKVLETSSAKKSLCEQF